MRKVIASYFISLDGVVEEPGEWHLAYFSDEMGAVIGEIMAGADTALFGRTTYEGMAAAWPEREAAGEEDEEFARALGDQRKIVVSSRPQELPWRNSEQLEGDLVEGVRALKAEPGGDISISGSVSVARQLLAAGLLDELHLLLHPVAVRHGMRLFDEADTAVPLQLRSSRAIANGVLYLVYGPA
jgi:dihydrofolate reductase